MSKETQSIFQPGKDERRPLAVTFHNVGDLLVDAAPELRDKVNTHYGPRSGANDYGARTIGIVVDTPNTGLTSHAQYLGSVYENASFQVYSPDDLRKLATSTEPKDPKPLVVPYFHSQQTADRFRQLGVETWGLPPQLVEELKNKARFHELVKEAAIEGFEVPEYKITHKGDYVKDSLEIVRTAKTRYEQHGLAGRYPLGVMVRLEESDGNYGSSLVRQESDGRISITPDGNSNNKKFIAIKHDSPEAWATAWEDALALSKKLLYENVDPSKDPRIITSRLLDLEDSPGLSLVFVDGQYYSLGWNGQLQKAGSSACVGTSSYQPETESLAHKQKQYEESSAEIFAKFVQKTASNLEIPTDTLTGIVNVDLMLYGPLEEELRTKEGKPPALYTAESNSRWTNFTDGVGVGVGATGRKPTISDMKSVIGEGLATEDHVDLKGASYTTVREILAARDAKGKEGRVIVRMPDDPMGVIFLGDREKAKRELTIAVRDAKKIDSPSKAVPVFKNK